MSIWILLAGLFGGILAGIANTLAGNGSAITLSFLLFLGLPADVANGTNRIGILAQCSTASATFFRQGNLQISKNLGIILSMLFGSIAGFAATFLFSPEGFQLVIGYLMVFLLLTLLVKPSRWIHPARTNKLPRWLQWSLFFLMGVYGGFIQMGFGIFFLALSVLLFKMDILRSNVIKSFGVAIYTVVIIILFAWFNLIDWKLGILLAVGQAFGGFLAAHYAGTFPSANVVVHRLLVVIIMTSSIYILKPWNWFI
jgi:uncharacterized protein